MGWYHALRTRLASWFRRDRWDAQLDADLQFHLEQEIAERVRAGVPHEEARRRARLAIGSLDRAKEECRDLREVPIVEPVWRDLRHAVRSLRRTPGFVAVAVATLALCLGANLTIFAVVDAVLVRPLPFPRADRLVTIVNSFPRAGVVHDGASLTSYYEWRGRIPAFASISAWRDRAAIVGATGSTERERVLRVTPEFFATLGAGPATGRAFTGAEMTPQTDGVAILTSGYWRTHFGADPDVIGRTLRINGRPHRIVGILPSGFHFLSSRAQIYLPLSSTAQERGVNNRYVSGTNVVARLRDGATIAQAQAQIEAHYLAHAAEFPWAKQIEDAGFSVSVLSLQADHVASVRPTLLLLQAGALFLLLIGAVNLVNLLLIRVSGRSHELGIRRSLGAGRGDIVRHLMVETIVVALAGGLAGLVVGGVGIRLLDLFGVNQLPLGAHIGLTGRVALVELLGALGVGFVVGLPIARFGLRDGRAQSLQSESRSVTSSRGVQRLRDSFVVAQIALAFVLLIGAGLLGVRLERTMSVSPGFRADHVLTGRVSLPEQSYPNKAARAALADRVVEALAHEPGVRAAGVVTQVPVTGRSEDNAMTVVGYTRKPGVSPLLHNRYGVTGDYFAGMGIPLKAGRFLASSDAGRRVCVVDENFARHYWPDGKAIGQRVFDGPPQDRQPDEAFTVVGVVGAVRQRDLTDTSTTGAIYFPFHYDASSSLFVVVRTSQQPEALASTVRGVVRRIDADLPVDDVQSMDGRIADSLEVRRSPALLAGVFALVALLLAAIGTYGVLSFAVARRRREIAVRMALGAQPGQIARQFLAAGLRLLLVGLLLGWAGAWAESRAMQSVLLDIPAIPAAILAVTAIVMSAVALAACFVPAARAARLPPTEALAGE